MYRPKTSSAFFAEKPQIKGLAVHGMPTGSPGTEQGDRRDPYETLSFAADGTPKSWPKMAVLLTRREGTLCDE